MENVVEAGVEGEELAAQIMAEIPEDELWDDEVVFEKYLVDKVLTQRYRTYPESVIKAHSEVQLREFAKAGRRAESFEN